MNKIILFLSVVVATIVSASPASEAAHLGTIVLLQPDSEMSARVSDTKAFSLFVREIVRAVSLSIEGQAKKVPESGWITVGIKPPNSTKFWINFKALGKEKLLIEKIETNLRSVPCPVVKGNVAFSIYLNLFGDRSSPPTEPKLKGAVPMEWKGKRGQIPDEIFKEVWP
jgi:hypothetical protein